MAATMMKNMTRRFRIQYASDLHLEFIEKTPFQPILKPVAPFLALAGDIGRPDKRSYRDFLHYCSRNWQQTFVIAGNHELYNSRHSGNWRHMPVQSIDTASMRMELCSTVAKEFPNVHFMNRTRYDLPSGDLTILGATLWTDLNTEEKQKQAEAGMNDHRMIAVDEEPEEGGTLIRSLTGKDAFGWHRTDREWLRQEIAANAEIGRPVLVITHHLPTFDLIATKYQGSPLNIAFASECTELLRDPVRGWIAGHTHTGAHRTRGNIQLGVNPRGYPGEAGTGYSREMIMDIDVGPAAVDTRDSILMAAAAADDSTEEDVVQLKAISESAPGSQTDEELEQSLEWV
jgi:hypothetical protein